MSSAGTNAGAAGAVAKPQKSRRKISLPWFRQGSVNPPHPALSRQHTIDTPGSFQARLLRRQPSNQTGVVEMTWVISDHNATPGTSELTVLKGQQVEVIEVCSAQPEYCLVRMPTQGLERGGPVPEGTVPLAVLKQPPPPSVPKTSPRRTQPLEPDADAGTSDSSSTANTSSPVNKRRGFSGRKWLPQPLRKLSQGKVDKQSVQGAPDRPHQLTPLKKTPSDKRFKLPVDSSHKGTTSEGSEDDERTGLNRNSLNLSVSVNGAAGDEPEDEPLELPPPMKPIQDPTLVVNLPQPSGPAPSEESCGKRTSSLSLKALDGTSSADIAEIEQIVKERMEQHSEGLSKGLEPPLEVPEDLDGDGEAAGVVDEPIDMVGALRKREFALRELVDTEEGYVKDLAQVVEGYMENMRDPDCDVVMPEDLRGGKDKMVFGNIEAIYEWHRDFFMKALNRCLESPGELGPLFRRYERKLHMYVVYCQNKPVSEHIVSEYDLYFEELRVKMGHKLQLCDLLIKPVQRIMKYQLLIKDIYKQTERGGLEAEIPLLKQALHIMHVVPKAANDMMDVGRLQKFDGKITAQGKLLLHGPLMCWDGSGDRNSGAGVGSAGGKSKEMQVFLFEQNIIFSEGVGKRTQFTNPGYIYKVHIQVNKMLLEELPDEGPDLPRFIIQSTDPRRAGLSISCTAATAALRNQWVHTITSILQTQRDFLKAIQSPIAYQKELTKDVSTDLSAAWNLSVGTSVSEPLQQTGTGIQFHGLVSRTNSDKQHHRKAAMKTKTLSIPNDTETKANNNHLLVESSGNRAQTQSPTKLRLHFLDGFRNTLRSKQKSDDDGNSNGNAVNEEQKDERESNRRWSETNSPNYQHCSSPLVMAPGTPARLLHDCCDLQQGDVVNIVRYDAAQGYLVRHLQSAQELWLPAQILSCHSSRKLWNFRFRKPSFNTHGRKSLDGSLVLENGVVESPEFIDRLKDVTTTAGTTVILKCCLRQHGCKVTWSKTEPEPNAIRNGGRFSLAQSDDSITLTIRGVRLSDSGTYCCTAINESGSAQNCAVLVVKPTQEAPLDAPQLQVLNGTSVMAQWEPDPNNLSYMLEYCRLGSAEWVSTSPTPVTSCSHVVGGLVSGESYSFRVTSGNSQRHGPPSLAVTLPQLHESWQQQHFHRRYQELDELGRGRFSIVRLARDVCTGHQVALKQVLRRKQPQHITQAEYQLLAGSHCVQIVRAMALFDNAPRPGTDTIVMELVRGPLLFNHVCKESHYTEAAAMGFVSQLFTALDWLHHKNVAHLDIKPENVMVDIGGTSPVLKLVDFGDSVGKGCTARNVAGSREVLPPPPTDLEFAAPESVLGQPVGPHTDIWAAGVLLYVFLSGVSPFLDDSMEETTANILKVDFCFPDEYFNNITPEAQNLLALLLVGNSSQRPSARQCIEMAWFQLAPSSTHISSVRLQSLMERRKSKQHLTTPNKY